MSIIEAILLGLVQGLTEFIPVSSSGHLVIIQELFGVEGGGLSFDVALHSGTLLALVIYFHKDIWQLFLGLLGKNDHQRLAWLIVLATVPAALVGVAIQDLAESSLRSPGLAAANLMIVGGLMIWAERLIAGRQKLTSLLEVNRRQALVMGVAQAAALVPGVSRAGGTITAGLFMGMERVAATRFSFLMAIPITFGAVIKVLLDGGGQELSGEPVIFSVGIIVSLLSGLLAIRFLLRFLSKHSLRIFAYYRIGLGLLVVAALLG